MCGSGGKMLEMYVLCCAAGWEWDAHDLPAGILRFCNLPQHGCTCACLCSSGMLPSLFLSGGGGGQKFFRCLKVGAGCIEESA
eukprot:CAMPEP_0174911478 /NCGR_PEP_ID=MMETSP0167-20121228/76817_1 /TAXON_ID=38298 /ORGANISM="Rhodella maculata, Strain CCMP736" /LENGTH=82 /DNA_ID=CAMNT_0016155987 /DNA_START=1 /DNA_END=245 /DNA_ORIENTATION=+